MFADPAGVALSRRKREIAAVRRRATVLRPACSIHRRFSWVSSSRSRHPTSFNWAPIAPIRPARPKAASWSSRKSSASIITSARSATGSRAKAIPPLRRRCSTDRRRISSAAIRRTRSPTRANSSPTRIGARCCKDTASRDRRAQEGRPGRHHRLLHGRHHRLPRGLQAQRPVRGDRLLRRADRQESPTRSRKCRCRCISARRTSASR